MKYSSSSIECNFDRIVFTKIKTKMKIGQQRTKKYNYSVDRGLGWKDLRCYTLHPSIVNHSPCCQCSCCLHSESRHQKVLAAVLWR